MGDGVKEMGREEGGDEVPVIDKRDGGDAAGTDRSYGAVLKFNNKFAILIHPYLFLAFLVVTGG